VLRPAKAGWLGPCLLAGNKGLNQNDILFARIPLAITYPESPGVLSLLHGMARELHSCLGQAGLTIDVLDDYIILGGVAWR